MTKAVIAVAGAVIFVVVAVLMVRWVTRVRQDVSALDFVFPNLVLVRLPK